MNPSKVDAYKRLIEAELPRVINRTALAVGSKYTGKVRDVYADSKNLLLVTTDRLSAFDRLLACIPFKGAVLNLTAAWWFEKTAHIIPNHVVAVPHPNIVSGCVFSSIARAYSRFSCELFTVWQTVARKCTPFKIEFVVRGYLTGSTSTSIWVHYKAGARNYCGHSLEEGAQGPLRSALRWPSTVRWFPPYTLYRYEEEPKAFKQSCDTYYKRRCPRSSYLRCRHHFGGLDEPG